MAFAEINHVGRPNRGYDFLRSLPMSGSGGGWPPDDLMRGIRELTDISHFRMPKIDVHLPQRAIQTEWLRMQPIIILKTQEEILQEQIDETTASINRKQELLRTYRDRQTYFGDRAALEDRVRAHNDSLRQLSEIFAECPKEFPLPFDSASDFRRAHSQALRECDALKVSCARFSSAEEEVALNRIPVNLRWLFVCPYSHKLLTDPVQMHNGETVSAAFLGLRYNHSKIEKIPNATLSEKASSLLAMGSVIPNFAIKGFLESLSTQRNELSADNVKEFFEDPVTCEPYANPFLLKCGHTYGEETLSQLNQHDPCPLCREPIAQEKSLNVLVYIIINGTDTQDEPEEKSALERQLLQFEHFLRQIPTNIELSLIDDSYLIDTDESQKPVEDYESKIAGLSQEIQEQENKKRDLERQLRAKRNVYREQILSDYAPDFSRLLLAEKPGFWRPILYKNPGTIYEKVQTFVDDYFYAWGNWSLVEEDGKAGLIHHATVINRQNYPQHPLYETAIKILSFCTVVIPLLVLATKIALRWKYSFNLNSTTDEGKEAVKNLAWKFFMPRQT